MNTALSCKLVEEFKAIFQSFVLFLLQKQAQDSVLLSGKREATAILQQDTRGRVLINIYS